MKEEIELSKFKSTFLNIRNNDYFEAFVISVILISAVAVGFRTYEESFNPELSKAERLADFIELGELMIYDALDRKESCGGHFREEYQTEEGEALRNDKSFLYVSAWEYSKDNNEPILHKENLEFEVAKPTQRSFK